VMEISFPQFGRTLRNPVRVQAGPEALLKVPAL